MYAHADTHAYRQMHTDRQTDTHNINTQRSTWNELLSPEIVVLRFGMDSM